MHGIKCYWSLLYLIYEYKCKICNKIKCKYLSLMYLRMQRLLKPTKIHLTFSPPKRKFIRIFDIKRRLWENTDGVEILRQTLMERNEEQ